MRNANPIAARILRSPSRERLDCWLLNAADVGIAGALFLTALALGGRHDAGRWLYALSASVAMLAISVRAALCGESLSLPRLPGVLAAAALAVPVLQVIPLPAGWLATLAPGHAQLLPLWNQGASLGSWTTISLTPGETLEGVALLLSHALLFYAVHNRVRTESDARRLLSGIGLAALAMALLAVMQHAGWSNGKLLGLYDHPHRRFDNALMGTFANRNHLAHYLLCGAACLAPLAWSSGTPKKKTRGARSAASAEESRFYKKRTASLIGIVTLCAISLATMSRGALLALSVGVATVVGLRWLAGRLRLAEVVMLGSLCLGVLLVVSFFDYERVTSRLDDLVSGEIEELDAGAGRRLIWEANASAFLANPWLGHGAGSHRHVYPAYLSASTAKEYTHAESGYLQIASECGAAGLTVLLIALGSVAVGVVKGLRDAETDSRVALWAAIGAVIAISVSHSLVDFVWYLPCLTAIPLTGAAIAWRLPRLQTPRAQQTPQPFAWPVVATTTVAAASLACLSGPAAGSLAWDTYVRASRSLRLQEQPVTVQRATDAENHQAAIEAGRTRTAELLAQTLARDTTNARAHSRYANRCLLLFEQHQSHAANPMTLHQVQDTIARGGFASPLEAKQWMGRAFGETTRWLVKAQSHANLAMHRSPLQAKAYLVLAELSFLNPRATGQEDLIEQALKLRPHDGGLRYQAGRLHHTAGRLDEALEQYRLSLMMPGSHRERLVATLAPLLPAEQLIEALEPDGPATELLFANYRWLTPEDQRAGNANLLAIANHARKLAADAEDQTPLKRARGWRRLSLFYRELDEPEKAVSCAEHAGKLLPNDFWVRHELAFAYLLAEQDDSAEPHLRWCLARRPDMRHLPHALKSLARRRADAEYQEREDERQRVRVAALQRVREQSSKPLLDNE